MNLPRVSIIIPVRAVNDYIRESIPEILKLDWPNFEIIIITDQPDKVHQFPKTKFLSSGPSGPAKKRDLGVSKANGEIIAFLDDDAYPKADWLKKSIHCFLEDSKVGAVGGPAITPKSDGILQKVSGAVFESYLGGAGARNRYLCIGDHCLSSDWPTVNLLVRRDLFMKIGGFDSHFWPGEDTKLCLDIINAGYTIKYDPEAVVYHHRRANLLKHFQQIGNYGLHRGHFAKIYPKTSLKLTYFVPSLFVTYFGILVISFFRISSLEFRGLLAIPLLVYIFGLIVDSIIISVRWRNVLIGLLTMPMIFFTHIWYGIRFIQGLIASKLKQ